jgi:cholesterol transport system auxiliary component
MNVRQPAFACAALCAALLSAGCTGLFKSSAAPEQLYYLRATAPAASTGGVTLPVGAPTIRILTPLTAPGLETTHIMLVQADNRMSVYTASRWPGTVPEVVEALAAQTLRASGAWSAVMDSGSPFPADYLLRLSVRRFEADYSAGTPPTVYVVLDCGVGRRAGRDLIAAFSVSGSATASADRMSAVVAAFEQAANAALAQLAQQTQTLVSADVQAHPATEH